MAKLIIPTPLRKYTADQSTFEGDGQTVGEMIRSLTHSHQGLKPHLLDADGRVRPFVRIYVGEDDIHSLQGEDTAVGPETIISIIPAIAGGSSNRTVHHA